MNQDQQNRWKSEALDAVFEAMAASDLLTEWLIYKGARVLNRRLGSEERQSLDIDSNLATSFAQERSREEQGEDLEAEVQNALDDYFEQQDPVRYEASGVRVKFKPNPKKPHPEGWDALEVVINLKDLKHPNNRGQPSLTIDIAAPEALREGSTDVLPVGEHEVVAYTLQRLAGEKFRAFLSSLPAYRRKMKRPGDAVRAKDVYDIARVHREYPLDDTALWQEIGKEFRLACQSRYIDCEGLSTFEEDLDVTRSTYNQDKTIPSDKIPFDEAWEVVKAAAAAFTAWGIIPFEFLSPDRNS